MVLRNIEDLCNKENRKESGVGVGGTYAAGL